MNRALLQKLHRWIKLIFAAPLLIVIVTGLILSFQPVLEEACIKPGAVRTFVVSKQSLRPADNNWPRLIHEGNWSGIVSGALNAITSAAMLALLGTGLLTWSKRRFRRRPARGAPSSVIEKQAQAVQ